MMESLGGQSSLTTMAIPGQIYLLQTTMGPTSSIETGAMAPLQMFQSHPAS